MPRFVCTNDKCPVVGFNAPTAEVNPCPSCGKLGRGPGEVAAPPAPDGRDGMSDRTEELLNSIETHLISIDERLSVLLRARGIDPDSRPSTQANPQSRKGDGS